MEFSLQSSFCHVLFHQNPNAQSFFKNILNVLKSKNIQYTHQRSLNLYTHFRGPGEMAKGLSMQTTPCQRPRYSSQYPRCVA